MPSCGTGVHIVAQRLALSAERVHGQGKEPVIEIPRRTAAFYVISIANIKTQFGRTFKKTVLLLAVFRVRHTLVCAVTIIKGIVGNICYVAVHSHDKGYLDVLASKTLVSEKVDVLSIYFAEHIGAIHRRTRMYDDVSGLRHYRLQHLMAGRC